MRLSIIIPMFNTGEYLNELLKVLNTQKNEKTEIIVIDDGSNEPYKTDLAKVYRKENGGVSSARNLGLKKAKGEYIVFIDSDDMVSDDYIEQIFKAIENDPDTVYLSWESMDKKFGKIIKDESDEFNPWNRCVWNRVFKRTYIEGMTFNEEMQVAEDDDFLNHLPTAQSKTYISKAIYFYRVRRKGGLTDRKLNGEFVEPDIRTQVVVYCGNTATIGGIETFIYNFCRTMCKYYDILVLYTERMDGLQILRLAQYVQVMRNQGKLIECDTAINIRLTDELPSNVRCKRRIQMSHTCQLAKSGPWHWEIKKNFDDLIFVSQTAADSFADQQLSYKIIPNLTDETEPKKALLLISACRLTWEKGEERVYKLAEMFRSANIPFTWLVFSHQPLKRVIPGVVHVPSTLDVRSYFPKADYVVQLSDIESFCYTLVEALELGVPVITTPLGVLNEIGVKDGENGYILPFDMQDVDVKKIYEHIPEFEPQKPKNEKIVKEWRKLLGNTKPKNTYKPDTDFIKVVVVENYGDLELNRNMQVGEVVTMRSERAIMLINRGLVAKA